MIIKDTRTDKGRLGDDRKDLRPPVELHVYGAGSDKHHPNCGCPAPSCKPHPSDCDCMHSPHCRTAMAPN